MNGDAGVGQNSKTGNKQTEKSSQFVMKENNKVQKNDGCHML